MSTAFPTLFPPAPLGSHQVKNRLMMAPMVSNYADEAGLVTTRYPSRFTAPTAT